MKSIDILNPIARSLLALIFVVSGLGKIFEFQQTGSLMETTGFPLPSLFLVGAILIEILGGIGLLLGYRTRVASVSLIVFVVAATLIFHARFALDPIAGQEQIVHVLKNLAIIGGLTKYAVEGGGVLSFDRRRERKQIIV